MNLDKDILEIPVSKTKNVDDLVRWFEHEKVYEKKHPTVALEKDDMPALFVIAVFGIWKNKKINLDKVREEQWGKRK